MKIFKKLTAGLLAAALIVAGISFNSMAADSQLTGFGGWYETAYATWSNETNIAEAKVEYKKTDETDYTAVDSELIRQYGSDARVDILGIARGNYDIKITTGSGEVLTAENVFVGSEDRSGYAHFNYSTGVGAYKNDGTPKSSAEIIYVTNETKNTVSYGGYTGLVDIIKHSAKINKPLIIRIIGTIDTQTRDADGTKTTDINNGVVALNGLTDRVMSADSYFNMCDVSSAANLTVEGVGTDAQILKWGFTFSGCTGVEVKNLNFSKYPEDACSTSGGERIWFHRCTFDVGENKYDLTEEQDKHEGDGSTDMNESKNITISYCRYNDTHKSSLNGGSNSTKQYNYTYHHNYFNNCSSRLPLTRYVNLHMYNNYTYGAGSAISSRASSWVFSEANYYENSKQIYGIQDDSTYGSGFIKAYNDVVDNSTFSTHTNIHQTATRTETFTASNTKHPTDTQNFDVKSSVFYFDDTTKTTDVTHLTDAATAKAEDIANSGVMTDGQQIIDFGASEGEDDPSDPDPADPTGIIDKAYELTPSNLADTPYFEQTGDFSSSNESRIRLTTLNRLTFTVAAGAKITVTASHASSTDKTPRDLIVYSEATGEPVGTVTFQQGAGSKTELVATGLEGEYYITASGDLNVTSVLVEFDEEISSSTESSTESTTESTTVTTTESTTESTTVTTTESTTESTTVTTTESTTESTTVTTTESTTETTTAATESSTEASSEEPEPVGGIVGDVDNNGFITANDCSALLSFVLNSDYAKPNWRTDKAVADVNADEEINSADAAVILKKVLNSSFKFTRQ